MTDQRRLVLVVRADPVIWWALRARPEPRGGRRAAWLHPGPDRDLAARHAQPIRAAPGPLDGVLPYSDGIEVERPGPVGDYKVPDGRFAGLTGRLVELFTDGVPTVCMSLYLSLHTTAVAEALRVARSTGLPSRPRRSRRPLVPT